MSNNEKQTNNETRDSFTSKTGFILACIGSAVGMGNIWLFPYRVGQFGGAAFLIPYLIFIILLGYTGLMGEFAFGRMTQTGPIGSFKKALETKVSFRPMTKSRGKIIIEYYTSEELERILEILEK